MSKILIADDHQIFNDGLKQILSPYFEVVSQVFNGRDVIPAIQKFQPHITVLDINLPNISGLEVGKEIKKSFPTIKLVYLSMYNEANFVKAAKEITADGYLLKDSSGAEILQAIQKIVDGQQFFDLKINNSYSNLHHQDYFVKQYSLSKREIEVISLVRKGYSSEEIAELLCIGFETVRSHRKNIFIKLGINKLSDLIQFAIKYGL